MTTTGVPRPLLFTVGHSTHTSEHFLALLTAHGVTAVADVRSKPYSQYTPQFNRETLSTALKGAGIKYVFLGRELGARRDEPEAYENGQARYELVRSLPEYKAGIDRLRQGIRTERVALMCAERDPVTCHRTILVSRSMRAFADVLHILADGSVESAEQADDRLLALVGCPAQDLFRSRAELVDEAYDRQAERIAFVEHEETGRVNVP